MPKISNTERFNRLLETQHAIGEHNPVIRTLDDELFARLERVMSTIFLVKTGDITEQRNAIHFIVDLQTELSRAQDLILRKVAMHYAEYKALADFYERIEYEQQKHQPETD